MSSYLVQIVSKNSLIAKSSILALHVGSTAMSVESKHKLRAVHLHELICLLSIGSTLVRGDFGFIASNSTLVLWGH